jgi:hypothetical protein
MTESADGKGSAQKSRPICGERTALPTHLVQIVLGMATPGTAVLVDVECYLRCSLEGHVVGNHYALVMELDAYTAVWTHWIRGQRPDQVFVLPDCPVTSSSANGGEPCSEFAGHPGGHSHSLVEPCAPPTPQRHGERRAPVSLDPCRRTALSLQAPQTRSSP